MSPRPVGQVRGLRGGQARAALLALVTGVWLLMTVPAAHAGRPCEQRPPATADIERGMALAQRTAQKLDERGADVVVLARAGQDLSRYGLTWSHIGLVYRDRSDAARPVWRVVHKLNLCGTDRAQVWRQGLGEFFMDQPFRYEAAFVPLTPELQQRLLPLLQDNARLAQWHTPRYSMVSYAWGQRYQQSNQWALETLAGGLAEGPAGAAVSPPGRAQAQAWLQAQGYEPGVLRLGPLTRLGARVTSANVAFDDHPNAKRFTDRIETVTADSVFTWLARTGRSGPLQTVR